MLYYELYETSKQEELEIVSNQLLQNKEFFNKPY